MTTEELLQSAHLRYVTDTIPGFSRKQDKDSFLYFDLHNKQITDKQIIYRIDSLAIPPAWQDVWISPYHNSHLQATGIDDRKRKQYRYHPLWVQLSQEKKFDHMITFANELPKIRNTVRNLLDQTSLTREKILATVIWLLENTLIRVGNEIYEEENKSYGLTTLKKRHVEIKKEEIYFSFKGKSGVYHNVHTKSKKVAKIIKSCQELPGQDLFEYKDTNGTMQTISSHDVNEFLKQTSGEDITAKDFRTWAGTLLAAKMCDQDGLKEKTTETKKTITKIVKDVASHLQNLPSTCKKYYIHPAVFEAYSSGYTLSNIKTYKKFRKIDPVPQLSLYENEVIGLVQVFEKKD